MFNLDNYLYGHCHTYLPNETYLAKADGHLYAYGLNTDLNFVLPWYIFLHSKQVKIQQLWSWQFCEQWNVVIIRLRDNLQLNVLILEYIAEPYDFCSWPNPTYGLLIKDKYGCQL